VKVASESASAPVEPKRKRKQLADSDDEEGTKAAPAASGAGGSGDVGSSAGAEVAGAAAASASAVERGASVGDAPDEEARLALLRWKAVLEEALEQPPDAANEAAARALDALESSLMTIDLLGATGLGKVVNKLRKHEKLVPTLQTRARQLYEKWKALATS